VTGPDLHVGRSAAPVASQVASPPKLSTTEPEAEPEPEPASSSPAPHDLKEPKYVPSESSKFRPRGIAPYRPKGI
jgi:hypothetical protein